MALRKQWYGPLWPMPPAGAGDSIIGAFSSEELQSSEYYEAVAMDIIFSALSTNTSDTYVLLRGTNGTFSRANTGTIVMILAPGATRNLAFADYGSNRYRLSDFGWDSDDAYGTFFACAIMQ